jgi:hypothetical protein
MIALGLVSALERLQARLTAIVRGMWNTRVAVSGLSGAAESFFTAKTQKTCILRILGIGSSVFRRYRVVTM